MKILIVGGGGREHAIAKSLSKEGVTLYVAPGNGGIADIATLVNIGATDTPAVVNFCKSNQIDLCIVAPDDPLVLGMSDALRAEGIPTFGPSKAAAHIEGSKAFSKDLMKKYNIPTAKYENFTEIQPAIAYLKAQNAYPIVIKASGLALGKGVIIAQSFEEAEQAVVHMLDGSLFGKSGSEIVIEEFLEGVEVSVLAFTDGKTVAPLVSARDHKRAYDNDEGLNTGGMGTIAPNPDYTCDLAKRAMAEIFIPTVQAMNNEGRKFQGVLFFGLMLTGDGPKVIEYNCRFGDPEAQVCLSLLETPLIDIIKAVIDEKLGEIEIKNKDKSAICLMLASGGYPESYEKGKEIMGLDAHGQNPAFDSVFHSGTRLENGKYYTNGGRVLGLCCVEETLEKAIERVYENVDKVIFEKCHYRKDIGAKKA